MANQRVITNREWINCRCYREDLAQVNRMFLHMLNTKGPGIESPMWEKEKYWEQWLNMPFNPNEWARADRPKDPTESEVPKDYFYFNRCRYGATQLA